MSAEKSRDECASVVEELFELGESVIAVLPFTQVPRLKGACRDGMRQKTRRYRPLVLTNRRLFVLDTGRTPRPRGLIAQLPHADVHVVKYTPPRAFGLRTLVLELAGFGDIPFIVGRLEREDADRLVVTLGHAG